SPRQRCGRSKVRSTSTSRPAPCPAGGRRLHSPSTTSDGSGWLLPRRCRSTPTASTVLPERSLSSTMQTAGPSELDSPAQHRSPQRPYSDQSPKRITKHNKERGHDDRSFIDPS